MRKFLRSRLSARICVQVVALAVPLLLAATWYAAWSERAAVREMLLDRGRVAALSGAAAYASVLEAGVDAGAISLQSLLEPTYEEIRYAFPVEGRRFHTGYDQYTDTHGIQRIEDAILASSPDFVYASGIDTRGYVPTPHTKYSEAPTGDVAHDRRAARAKRKYDDPEQLAAAGYRGQQPTLVLDYLRDTGEAIWDVVAPITVKGRHFGGFRVGVRQDQLDARARDVLLSLSLILGAAVVLLGVAVLLVARRTTRPLVELAHTATRLSTDADGTELRRPVPVTTQDEVGEMATALNRMRQSMLRAIRVLDSERAASPAPAASAHDSSVTTTPRGAP